MEIQFERVKRHNRANRPLFVDHFDSSSDEDSIFPLKRTDEANPKPVPKVKTEEIEKLRQKLLELNLTKVSFASIVLAVKQRCVCPICHLILLDATLLSCGHLFCDFCIRQWQRHSWTCPTCGVASNSPVTKRIWAIDTFLSDFHTALEKVAREEWAEDPIPESQINLNWTFAQMKSMMKKPPLQTPIMSAASRSGLIEQRQNHLATNPVQFTEHGGNSSDGRFQFFLSYFPTVNQLIKNASILIMIYVLLALDAHIGIINHVYFRCALIAVLLTWLGRRLFYFTVDDDWNTTPQLLDWFFLEAFGLDPDENLGAPDDEVVNAIPWDALVEAALASERAHRRRTREANDHNANILQ